MNEPQREQLRARILSSITVDPATGCWEWNRGRHPLGYGILWIDGKCWRANRAAWEAFVGPIPEGLVVRHKRCDNPPCCNFDHMATGTKADNSKDMVEKLRSPIGERHGHAKLTTADVREIRRLVATGGLTRREIGARFGVLDGAVSRIATGKRWGRVA